MRNLTRRILVTVFACLAPVLSVQAQNVGVVDLQYLMQNAPQAERLDQQLQQNFGPAQEEMQAKQEEYEELTEELERDELVMDEDEREEKEEELAGLEAELEQMQQQMQQQFGQQRQEAYGQMQQLVAEEAEALAEEEGFDVVVGQGVLYASDAVNLTDRVLERLERRAESDDED